MEYITVTVKNQSAFANTYEIVDDVANVNLGKITLGPNAAMELKAAGGRRRNRR